MSKGLVFVVILAMIYWAIYYTSDFFSPRRQRTENRPVPERVRDSVREANVSLLQTTLEIFRHQEGRNPQTLEELVEKGYIRKLPDDGGQPFEYDRQAGRVK